MRTFHLMDDRFSNLFEGDGSALLTRGRATTELDVSSAPDTSPAKRVQSKMAWAQQGRRLTGQTDPTKSRRLPPGQSLTKDWPVLDLGTKPLVPLDQWSLTLTGAVAHRRTWDWAAFQAEPQTKLVTDVHCVTAWSAYDFEFEGVSVSHLLGLVQPRPEVKFVGIMSHDGYRTSLPLAHFDRAENMIAHSWRGAPLSREHGGPARLLVPHLYLWKSAKWIRQLTFLVDEAPGFWETRGYHAVGDPWKEERYDY